MERILAQDDTRLRALEIFGGLGLDQVAATLQLREGPREKIVDGFPSVVIQVASACARKVLMCDLRIRIRGPRLAGPVVPSIAVLIEYEKRFVAEFRELRTPARAALHCAVIENMADHIDFLTAVHLMPDALKDLSE